MASFGQPGKVMQTSQDMVDAFPELNGDTNCELMSLVAAIEVARADLKEGAATWHEGLLQLSLKNLKEGTGNESKMQTLLKDRMFGLESGKWGVSREDVQETLLTAAQDYLSSISG